MHIGETCDVIRSMVMYVCCCDGGWVIGHLLSQEAYAISSTAPEPVPGTYLYLVPDPSTVQYKAKIGRSEQQRPVLWQRGGRCLGLQKKNTGHTSPHN
jgi:hypothetical protein